MEVGLPIENEIKYLLRAEAFDAALEEHGPVVVIEQYYVAENCRVRSMRQVGLPARRVFTFKKATRSGLVEIETEIGEEDYDLLKEAAIGGISKTRTSFRRGEVEWDVDRFETGNGCFVIAEPEMPLGMDVPTELPSWLTRHLVRELGRDPEWSNQSMSRPGRLLEIAGMLAIS